eukprot:CAMPEP_0175098482 /NCGR_PEP_ID=MMETSP0086_2-20121207/5890_1 /TAXON_ID=136419 /ORGANISM="Unknown Unknown, Strain D1" /LENGTH=265 /DNA_ID=CAMNT_0016372155 /DNA_START=84 /DNA_END=883 /DNA_ORIENTATION=-
MTLQQLSVGLSSAEKKQQDEQDQLIRLLQAKLAAAEKKKRLQKEIVGVLMVAKLLQTANEKRFAAAPESAAPESASPSIEASQKVAAVASSSELLGYLLEHSQKQEDERERERRCAAEQERRQADERKRMSEGVLAVAMAVIKQVGHPKASEQGQATKAMPTPARMVRDWTTEDFTSFIDQQFRGDTSVTDSIKEACVDGSDLNAHISENENGTINFNATDFCRELHWDLDQRKMNMLEEESGGCSEKNRKQSNERFYDIKNNQA